MTEPVHVFESELGEDFISFGDWVAEKATAAQRKAFDEEEAGSEKHRAVYLAWVKDQKITKHTIEVDGVITNSLA